MKPSNFLSIAAILCFFGYVLFFKNGGSVRKSYLTYVLLIFPLIDLFATPVSLGGFTVFDFVTFGAIFFFFMLGISPISGTKGLFLLFFFISILLAGALSSEFLKDSFFSFMKYFSILFYIKLLLDECEDDPAFIYLILRYLKVACLISLVFLILQILIGVQFSIYELNPNVSQYDSVTRFPSYFQDPQKYAQFLAMCSFLFLIETGNTKKYWKNLLLFGLVIICIFLTGVRAALLGVCGGLGFLFILGNTKFRQAGIVCLVFGYLTMLFFADYFAMFNRGSNFEDTAEVRFAYWRGAYEIFKAHPIVGIGVGNYQNYVSLYEQDQYWSYFGTIEYIDHPESGYLKILAETGIVGFTLFLGFLAIPVVSAMRSFFHGFNENKTVMFLLASILSWMIAFVTVFSFSDVRIFVMLVTLVCMIITMNLKRSFFNEV